MATFGMSFAAKQVRAKCFSRLRIAAMGTALAIPQRVDSATAREKGILQ
jgi:hypothetical protein